MYTFKDLTMSQALEDDSCLEGWGSVGNLCRYHSQQYLEDFRTSFKAALRAKDDPVLADLAEAIGGIFK